MTAADTDTGAVDLQPRTLQPIGEPAVPTRQALAAKLGNNGISGDPSPQTRIAERMGYTQPEMVGPMIETGGVCVPAISQPQPFTGFAAPSEYQHQLHARGRPRQERRPGRRDRPHQQDRAGSGRGCGGAGASHPRAVQA